MWWCVTSINKSTPVYTTRIAPGTETRRLSLENVNVERHRKLIHDVDFKMNTATNLPNAMKSYFLSGISGYVVHGGYFCCLLDGKFGCFNLGPLKKKLKNVIRPLFSSPDPEAQVSFSDQICPLSVVVVVGIFVINFSHFHLLLQNHWANFNQT